MASDIPAFRALLGEGKYGSLFESENPQELATKIIALLKDEPRRAELVLAGRERSKMFDWGSVAEQIFSIYEMSMVGSTSVRLASETRNWNRLLNRGGGNE